MKAWLAILGAMVLTLSFASVSLASDDEGGDDDSGDCQSGCDLAPSITAS